MKSPAVNYEELLAQLALEEKAAPSDPDIYLQRGRVQLARDRFADAAVALERAIGCGRWSPAPIFFGDYLSATGPDRGRQCRSQTV